ncbi:MAG: penicillin-binding protein 1B [Alteromonadales bacterium]|nr:penicillin-binding protein 1B [Alteromonadales bacterium]
MLKIKIPNSIKWLFTLSILVFIGFILVLDNTIRSTFSDRGWSIPSTVYARTLEIYVGATVKPEDLRLELQQLGYQFVSTLTGPRQVVFQQNGIEIYSEGFQFSDELTSAQKIKITIQNNIVVELESEDNSDLVRLEPISIGGIYPDHNEDRLLIQLSQVPETLQHMLVAVEDSEFYQHWGISPKGIVRALVANFRQGGISQGASTLTQQLIKNYYLSAEQTYSRKAKEAIMALSMELHFEKNEILQAYMNEIYLGQDGPRAIHGFGLASQYYFKRPIDQLSLDQQAMLVALVRGASYYNPWRNPERALTRRNLVLDIAVREGFLDRKLAEKAKQKPLTMEDKTVASNQRYPAYLDLVRRQLKSDYKAEDLSGNGLSIFTHFDPLVQSTAEKSLQQFIKKQKQKTLQGAVVITRPNTGEVIAIIGGKNSKFAGFNRALDAQRQVGSLIKPAVYLTALQQPEKYNLATLISDESYTLTQNDGQQWSPKNYDKKDHGEVLLYQGLANSYNQSTARLGNELGLSAIQQTIQQLGGEHREQLLPSMTLGAVDMAPLEVAQIYQTLAADGFYTPLLTIAAVVDGQGKALNSYPLQVEQRFERQTMYQLRYAMLAVTHEGTGKALQWLLPDFSVAGKTGTSNNLRDSWFAGFSGDMMAVVWLGRDDNQNAGLTGSSGALRVWADIFKKRSILAIQNIPPNNINISWVDKNSGVGSQPHCSNSVAIPFIEGQQPNIEIRCRKGLGKVLDWFESLADD